MIHTISVIPMRGRLAILVIVSMSVGWTSFQPMDMGSTPYISCNLQSCPKKKKKNETIVIHNVVNQVIILLNVFFMFIIYQK